MNVNELVQILGHSHKNKITNNKLKALGFEILSPSEDYSGVPFLVDYRHSELNIKLTFNGYNYFKRFNDIFLLR